MLDRGPPQLPGRPLVPIHERRARPRVAPQTVATRREDGGLVDRSETELIESLRARDLDALGEVYRLYGDAMTTLARSMMRDRDEAADVVEQALMRVRDAAPRFRGERGLRTWVMRIVANLCRDSLRRRKYVAGRPDELEVLGDAGLRIDPVAEWDEALDRATLLAALERAIQALPVEQRETVILRDRLGLSYEEVAATLGISLGGVKSRLFRAREALKKRMRPYLEEAS